MAPTAQSNGYLEVICGSMFSGKSEELIRRLRRAQYARKNILVFKHKFDDRTSTQHIVSHNGTKLTTYATSQAKDILKEATDAVEVVGIDETQFFPDEIVSVVCELLDRGKRVIVAGLDMDFRGVPFTSMPPLMAIADVVTKLKAICVSCGTDAQFSQRLINGNPARYDDPIVLVGAEERYQARCRECFIINRSSTAAQHGQV